jgi:hypothetical protein
MLDAKDIELFLRNKYSPTAESRTHARRCIQRSLNLAVMRENEFL